MLPGFAQFVEPCGTMLADAAELCTRGPGRVDPNSQLRSGGEGGRGAAEDLASHMHRNQEA